MPAVLGTAGPGIFDESAPVSLKGSRAGREFWVSLATRDEDEARSRARRLDGEADALNGLARWHDLGMIALIRHPLAFEEPDSVAALHRALDAAEGQLEWGTLDAVIVEPGNRLGAPFRLPVQASSATSRRLSRWDRIQPRGRSDQATGAPESPHPTFSLARRLMLPHGAPAHTAHQHDTANAHRLRLRRCQHRYGGLLRDRSLAKACHRDRRSFEPWPRDDSGRPAGCPRRDPRSVRSAARRDRSPVARSSRTRPDGRALR